MLSPTLAIVFSVTFLVCFILVLCFSVLMMSISYTRISWSSVDCTLSCIVCKFYRKFLAKCDTEKIR